jgi:hypothetical protein
MEAKGIAPLMIAVIVIVAGGASVATPVAVDSIDVDPDSPLYALERLGERIKGVSDVSAMKERFIEFSRMCDKGKGSQFLHIQDEVETLYGKLPEPKKAEVAGWLKTQETRVAKNRVLLLKEAALKLGEELKGTTAAVEVEKVAGDLEACSQEVSTKPEEVQARIELLKQKLESLRVAHPARVKPEVVKALEAERKVGDFEVKVRAEVAARVEAPPVDLQKELGELELRLAEIKAKLELAPKVAGGKAAEALVREAEEHRDKALKAAEDNKVRIGLIHSAKVLLGRAEKILDHAIDWENEHAEDWTEYKRAESVLEQRIEKLKTENVEVLKSVQALTAVAIGIRENIQKTLEAVQPRLKEEENEYAKKLEEARTAVAEGYENLRRSLVDAAMQWTIRRMGWTEEAKQKGCLGALLPLKVKISGSVDAEGKLSVVVSENREVSAETAWGTFSMAVSMQGSLQGQISEGKVDGTLSVSGSRSITTKYTSVSWSLSLQDVKVTGTVSDSTVECDVKGSGTATGTHAVSIERGSLNWKHSVSFEVSGKIVGSLVGGKLEGWMYLYISNVSTREISVPETFGGPTIKPA